jgi:hypothetical protein
MGRPLHGIAAVVGIAVITGFCASSASGEALVVDVPGASPTLGTDRAESAVGVHWSPGGRGTGPGPAESDGEALVGGNLVPASGIRLGAALSPDRWRAEAEVGLAHTWATHVSSECRPDRSFALAGSIEIGGVPIGGRLVIGRDRAVRISATLGGSAEGGKTEGTPPGHRAR